MSVFGSGDYNRKIKVLVVCLAGCAVVSVLVSCDYDRKKKVPVVCLAGCAFVSVFGSRHYDRKIKKFKSSVWRVVLLCLFSVLAITTGKKSSSHLSGGLCCRVSFWFW